MGECPGRSEKRLGTAGTLTSGPRKNMGLWRSGRRAAARSASLQLWSQSVGQNAFHPQAGSATVGRSPKRDIPPSRRLSEEVQRFAGLSVEQVIFRLKQARSVEHHPIALARNLYKRSPREPKQQCKKVCSTMLSFKRRSALLARDGVFPQKPCNLHIRQQYRIAHSPGTTFSVYVVL